MTCAEDHTCYTVDTAGAEGFIRLLPVYLDHVLFPTLKAAWMTYDGKEECTSM